MRSTVTIQEPEARRWRHLSRGADLLLAVVGVLLLLGLVQQLASSARDAGQTALIVGVILLWFSNVMFALPRWTTRLVFLCFHGSFALFILGQPLAALFGGSRLKMPVTRDGAMVALWMVAVSLLALRVGVLLMERWLAKPLADRSRRRVPPRLNRQSWTLLLLGCGIAVLCDLATGVDALTYVMQHDYSSYYVSHEARVPMPVELIGMMAPYLVAAVLGVFPRGRAFLWVCGAYFLMTMPYLAMGQRGAFIRMLIFLGSLVIIRWYVFGERTFRTKVVNLVCLAIALPLVVYGMGYIGQARTTTVGTKAEQSQTAPEDPTEAQAQQERIRQSNSVAAQFEAQSVTFSVIARGVAVEDAFPDHKCYTLGPLTDLVLYGSPGRQIFGNEDLGGQTIRRALVGSNFGHAFSYEFYGQDYLDGLGSGSSYLIENYVDGGLPAVGFFSLLLGGLLSALSIGYSRRPLLNMVLLIILEGIITLPRDAATGFLLFLVMPPFWLAFFCVWFVTRRGVQSFLARHLPWLGLVRMPSAEEEQPAQSVAATS